MALSRLTTNSFTPYGISLPAITTTSPSSQLNGMKNLLINGDFRVWQKGTSGSWSGNATTSADRWVHQYVDFTPAQTKQEDTINGETVDCLQLLKNGGTYASGEITQKVETAVAKYLRGQTVTFSFWVKKVGSTFGSHICQYWIGDSETVDDTGWTNSRTIDRSRSSGTASGTTSTTITFANNNWQKISVTRTLSSDTNTIYCTIYTSNTPNGEGIRIAKAQLEVGTVATDFERRPYALELDMSKRFCEVIWSPSSNDVDKDIAHGAFNGNTAFQGSLFWTIEKRSTPTVTLLSAGNYYVHVPGNFRVTMSSLSANNINIMSCHLSGTCGSSASAGAFCFIAPTENNSNKLVIVNSEF